MMTHDQTKQIVLGLLMNWFSDAEKTFWLGVGDELEREGKDLNSFCAQEIVVKKLLEVPDRGREMLLSFVNEGATQREFTNVIGSLLAWIDAYPSQVTDGDADAAITRICSGFEFVWVRTQDGYLLGPGKSSVRH